MQIEDTDGGGLCRYTAVTAHFRSTDLKKCVIRDAQSAVIGGVDHRQAVSGLGQLLT